ncbi:hypothetical protein RND81_13G186900 [Saponaria officinalis]|uniref:Ribosomal protein eL8/eL30/eS12/Gadd45 domain-containing protein n=1 Tax=Saponaria officinalis TaxID=3572 RepID=A0AAW1H2I9_SAPOF
MASKSKRKGSQTQLTLSDSLHSHKKLHLIHSNNFEGDTLITFLNSFQRVIESEKQSNTALPDNIWYKRQFAVGVNEVTRLLERTKPSTDAAETNPLQALLVASDCNPKWLTKHLPSLASSRNVPLIYVRDKKEGSLRLGELVKVKTAIAIGVKANGSNINHFVQGVLNPDNLNETGRLDSAEMAPA